MATPASLALNNAFENFDPSAAVVDRGLERLLALWRGRCPPGGIPGRSDIGIDALHGAGVLPNVLMIDVLAGGTRLRYRLVGTRIVEMAGRDATGRSFDELYPPELCERFLRVHGWVIAERRPARYTSSLHFHDKDYYAAESIWLPLTDGGQDVAIILGAMVWRASAAPVEAR